MDAIGAAQVLSEIGYLLRQDPEEKFRAKAFSAAAWALAVERPDLEALNHANELYAIKRVSLDKTDSETMSGYMNEIALLKRLDGNSRIIRLIDSEVKGGPGGNKGHLLLVMECGEIDLARLLGEQQKEPMNMVWVSYYWQQVGLLLPWPPVSTT